MASSAIFKLTVLTIMFVVSIESRVIGKAETKREYHDNNVEKSTPILQEKLRDFTKLITAQSLGTVCMTFPSCTDKEKNGQTVRVCVDKKFCTGRR